MAKSISEIQKLNRIIIPIDTIKLIIEKLGDDLIWEYDEIKGELIIMKRPESYVEALMGLGEEMWKEAEGTKYIEEMRDEWDR
jgi:bifunctional DNA-binding transcriptional regulator/antitoxin component of YhaV-PrlF toxin-antitoxin module